MAVMHKKFEGPYGYKLCEPFADDVKGVNLAHVTTVDSDVTCKWCVMKMQGARRKVNRVKGVRV